MVPPSASATSGLPSRGHVFISYVREDLAEVEWLQRALEASGIPVWRDVASLWPGEDWRAKIWEAITRDALVFVACFSSHSAARQKSYMHEELLLAVEQLRQRQPHDPWLIPVRFDNCQVPNLELGPGRTLRSVQRADLFAPDRDTAVKRLVEAIWRLLPEHAPPSQGMPPSESAQAAPAFGPRQENSAPGDAARKTPKPAWDPSTRAARLFSEAERAARSVTDDRLKAEALAMVAYALAATQPERAARLVDDAERALPWAVDPRTVPLLASAAAAISAANPDNAAAISTANPFETLLAPHEPSSPQALARAASALPSAKRWHATRLFDDAERAIRRMSDERLKVRALIDVARVAQAAGRTNRCRRLASEAYRAASSIKDQISRVLALLEVERADKDLNLYFVLGSHKAEQAARSISDATAREGALAMVAIAQASDYPEMALDIARSVTSQASQGAILLRVAEAIAPESPGRAARLLDEAERCARSVEDEQVRPSLLVGVGKVLAVTQPERAARLLDEAERCARSISDVSTRVNVLVAIAGGLIRETTLNLQ